MGNNITGIFILVGLALYGVVMIFQGMKSFRATSSSSETFYNADRGVNSFMLVCSTAVSVFSGLSYYGWPAAAYTHGIGYISGLGAFCTGLLFSLLGYRLWLLGKEYGFTTPTDFLRSRYYSEGFGIFVSLLLVIFIIPYVALQLITIGDGVNISSYGMMPYVIAVLFASIIIVIHVFGGGMKAIAWMDTFNFILAIGTLYILVTYLTLKYFPNGGLKEAVAVIQANPDTASLLSHPGPKGTFTVVGIVNQALTASVATIVWPHIFTRTFVAKSKKNFEVMAWGLPLGYLITFFGLLLIGAILAPAIVGPNFKPTDSLVPILSTEYCAPIVTFLSILCLFAFAVSTSESLLLSATGMVSKDIFIRHRFLLKGIEVDQRKIVKWSRYVVLLMMVVIFAIVVARPAAIVDYAYKLSSPFFAMIMPVTIGGLFWKKGSKEGAIVGTVAGVVIVIIGTFFVKLPLGFSPLAWGLFINTLLYVIVSLLTKVPDEIIDKYITRVENYISVGNDMQKIVGETILESTFKPEQLAKNNIRKG